MLPLSVRLRVTSPKFDCQVPDSEHWADHWEGFRLDGPGGRLGTIEAVGFDPATGDPAWLHVRTGLFVRRTVTIPFTDIESIDPIRGRVTVTNAGRWPRGDVAGLNGRGGGGGR
jgi:hypothetical protein